ncbi:tetraspanin-16 [Ochotona curzoniae]|uniref:tetraspanin-16 n=1 Tax=Ochotona curzoniae TaxID=130825 RepID=UPI001B34641C|nr:tetraspanin-16 [Ochotona curzoniae]
MPEVPPGGEGQSPLCDVTKGLPAAHLLLGSSGRRSHSHKEGHTPRQPWGPCEGTRAILGSHSPTAREDADLHGPGQAGLAAVAEPHRPYSCLKKLSSSLSGLVLVSGIFLLGLGIHSQHSEATLTRVLGLASAHLRHVGHLCLLLGSTVALLSVASCHGAAKDSRGTLLLGFLSMAIVIVMEVTAAAVVLSLLPVVSDLTLEHTVVTLKKNYRGYNEPDDYSSEWNLVMEKLQCCGVNNHTDFVGSAFETSTGHSYPRGCCRSMGTAACDGHDASSAVIHQRGCFSKLLEITKRQSSVLSGGSLGAAVMQLPGTLAALLLFMKLG